VLGYAWKGEVEGEEEGGPVDCSETEDILAYYVWVCWLEGGRRLGRGLVGYAGFVSQFASASS